MKKKFNIGIRSEERSLLGQEKIEIDYASIELKIKDKLNVHLTPELRKIFTEAVEANPEKVDMYLQYINHSKEAFLNVLKADI